jgi:hypothetical protein
LLVGCGLMVVCLSSFLLVIHGCLVWIYACSR